jgi:hypothetical protein
MTAQAALPLADGGARRWGRARREQGYGMRSGPARALDPLPRTVDPYRHHRMPGAGREPFAPEEV